uniref:ERF1_1 domain-containing protein n=1 Tax=Panagrellus redivivus TaxID=6233 RepID=A0A7E4V4S9_PANRE
MKLLEHSFEEDGSEFMRLLCNTQDDFWQLYNVVHRGDRVEALTTRKIKGSGRRSKCVIEVLVTSIEFDPAYCGIRFRGYVNTSTTVADMADSHTLDIKVNLPFKVTKKRWLPVDFQRIETTFDVRHEAVMAAVVLHEGVAQIFLLKRSMTVVKATVNMQVARKRAGATAGHDTGVEEFLETTAKTFMRHIKVEDMKAVILAGRGFIHKSFQKTLFNVADQMGQPITKKQQEKFVLVSVSSGYKHSVKEILNSPDTVTALANTAVSLHYAFLDYLHNSYLFRPEKRSKQLTNSWDW